MQILSGITLLAIVFAVLSSGSQSVASPTLPAASSAVGWPNQPGVKITREYPRDENGMRTALVRYKSIDAFLKCTTKRSQHTAEIQAISALSTDFHHSSHIGFPTLLDLFSTGDGYHCIITKQIAGASLREYVAQLSREEKGSFLQNFALTAILAVMHMHERKVIHGNINPDNIIIQPTTVSKNVFKVLFTGFEGSQPTSRSQTPSILGARGYAPPEDYFNAAVDQRKRDTWMLGATFFFVTNGIPPYGFAHSKTKGTFPPVSEDRLLRTMMKAEKAGKNSFPRIKTNRKGLLDLMERFLTYKAEDRVNIDLLTEDDLMVLVDDELDAKDSLLERTWAKLKSKMPRKKISGRQVKSPQDTDAWHEYQGNDGNQDTPLLASK
ncbi:kinase-like domain-containing protein [Thamnocephalis sphaerospora]|uniref:Kinase-like domain-containing protein n=1 Tax=Thamnocephalis sphaerospora TaxID=78915 RepID=A0A4P9XWB1_9FUNG|nr:kinase-like domain-containing protein [Thamnocephalis sphaerospora]|eukprot:RKP10613.1 kinase-like domain-containing protein [Thamnocephalis sphaerospora]